MYESAVYRFLYKELFVPGSVAVFKNQIPQRIQLTCTHNPLAIFTDANTLTGLLKLEILQQLNPVRILGVVFETALATSRKPLGKRSCGVRPGYRVNGNLRLIRQLHPALVSLQIHLGVSGLTRRSFLDLPE